MIRCCILALCIRLFARVLSDFERYNRKIGLWVATKGTWRWNKITYPAKLREHLFWIVGNKLLYACPVVQPHLLRFSLIAGFCGLFILLCGITKKGGHVAINFLDLSVANFKIFLSPQDMIKKDIKDVCRCGKRHSGAAIRDKTWHNVCNNLSF